MVSISYVDLCYLVHQTQFFPIWTLTTSSPSVTGFYRMKQTFRCTLSKILDLRYCTCIFNILLSLSQYEIMSVLTLHLTFCAAVFTYSIYTLKLKKNHRRLKYSLDTTNTYITFIFIEKKNAHLGTLNLISWSLCYPRLRDGFNVLCKNIENELRVYLSRRFAF